MGLDSVDAGIGEDRIFAAFNTRGNFINTLNITGRFGQRFLARKGKITSAQRSPGLNGAVIGALEQRVLLSAITVNTFVDQIDPAGSSTVSVRDAIALAKSRAGADTISLPAGNYKLALARISHQGVGLCVRQVFDLTFWDNFHTSCRLQVEPSVFPLRFGFSGQCIDGFSP